MAFRAILETEYRRARDFASEARRRSVELRDTSAAGNVSFNVVEGLHAYLVDTIAEWERIATVPGIAEYAQAQHNDPAYDIGAEFTAMVNAAAASRDFIETSIPKDVNGFWLVYSWDAEHKRVTRSFTPAQTVGLRTQLDALIATIG